MWLKREWQSVSHWTIQAGERIGCLYPQGQAANHNWKADECVTIRARDKKVDKAGLGDARSTLIGPFLGDQMNGPPVMAARALPFSAAVVQSQKQILLCGPRASEGKCGVCTRWNSSHLINALTGEAVRLIIQRATGAMNF
jgi:hypothetical protein